MRLRRQLPIFFGVLLIAAAVTAAIQLRKHAPPESARLLPGADGFIYLNLKWVRRTGVLGKLASVRHEPEYQQFIQNTGFEFEKDLDQAAFAVHYPAPGNGIPKDELRFSEVFVGRIDGVRLRDYLKRLSSKVESYNSIDIYNIPLDGRTVRVAILGVDLVAASNYPDPLLIRGIIDRSRKLASPFAGPAFLRRYFKEVPIASLGWAVLNTDPANPAMPQNLSFLLTKPAVLVASVRYLGSVHLRAEAFTATDEDARQLRDRAETFLSLFHAAEDSAAQGTDPDVKAFFNGLKVEQHRNRAVLTAVVPPAFLQKAISEPGSGPPSASQLHPEQDLTPSRQ
jgi:hypothetical protein